MFKKKSFVLILILVPIFLSGCISVRTGSKTTNSGADGGFYRSENKGADWAQKTLIPTVSGKPSTFADTDMSAMAIDPSDENAIYFGTVGHGMLYSYDAGESWFVARSLGEQTIAAIAVDPKVRCTIYASIGNTLKKTTDCARTWETKFTDDNAKAVIDHIAVDQNNSLKVYITTTKGGFYKSADGGVAWNDIDEIVEMKDQVLSITMLPSDPRHIIISLQDEGVYRTQDGGENWEAFTTLNEAVDEFKLGGPVIDIAVSKNLPDFCLAATSNGLLRSTNRGGKWEKIDIITPEKKTDITAIAFNPRNEQELYYSTVDLFYRSSDGGKSWTSETAIAGARSARKIVVHPKKGEVVYMAVGVYKK